MLYDLIQPVFRYSASSLDEFFKIISLVGNTGPDADCKLKRPIWYRGHSDCNWTLIPSLFREKSLLDPEKPFSYHACRSHENYSYQHFRARASHQIQVSLESEIEWREVMQHHCAKTRLMDWSESALTALIFALEPYIDTEDGLDLKQKRQSLTPSVWILRPNVLNRKIYKLLSTHRPFIDRALLDLLEDDDKRDRTAGEIAKVMAEKEELYFSCKDGGRYDGSRIDGILSLSTIDAMRQENASRLKELLITGEYNPFFYLAARYYSDGIDTPAGEILPPLAIVHPYHSERIRAQQGVFTAVPYNNLNDAQANMRKLGFDVLAMEHQVGMVDCIFEIRIVNVHEVSRELHLLGQRRSSIYPELENLAKEIEATRFFT